MKSKSFIKYFYKGVFKYVTLYDAYRSFVLDAQ